MSQPCQKYRRPKAPNLAASISPFTLAEFPIVVATMPINYCTPDVVSCLAKSTRTGWKTECGPDTFRFQLVPAAAGKNAEYRVSYRRPSPPPRCIVREKLKTALECGNCPNAFRMWPGSCLLMDGYDCAGVGQWEVDQMFLRIFVQGALKVMSETERGDRAGIKFCM